MENLVSKNILVLCTGNSCRSQIAEAYLRKFCGGHAQVYSAGIEKHGVNPKAVAIMLEDGIDITSHTSNEISDFLHIPFDIVITVCDHAKEVCPVLPGNAVKFHQSFPDPAKATGSDEDILATFRSVRNQIRLFCEQWSHDFVSGEL